MKPIVALSMAAIAAFVFVLAVGALPAKNAKSYKVVEASSHTELTSLVDAQIASGWEPQGGVAVAVNPRTYGWWYYQALTR